MTQASTGEFRTPLRRGVLLWGLLVSLAAQVHAGLSQEAWASGDHERMRRESQGDQHGTQLLEALRANSSDAALQSLHQIEASSAPLWMRAEALSLLCECSCAMAWQDSLRHQTQRLLALTGHGFTCPLQTEFVGTQPGSPGEWWLQVGAFSTESGAQEALKALGRTGLKSRVMLQGGLWKAQLGPCASRQAADETAVQLRKAGRLKDYRVVQGEGPKETRQP